jgi:hypothetical protein
MNTTVFSCNVNYLILVDELPTNIFLYIIKQDRFESVTVADKYSLDTETIPRRDIVKSGQEHFRKRILYWFWHFGGDGGRNYEGWIE